MSWNYRVLRHEDGSFALHEVYDSLERALRDARERPVLDAVDIGKRGLNNSLEFGSAGSPSATQWNDALRARIGAFAALRSCVVPGRLR